MVVGFVVCAIVQVACYIYEIGHSNVWNMERTAHFQIPDICSVHCVVWMVEEGLQVDMLALYDSLCASALSPQNTCPGLLGDEHASNRRCWAECIGNIFMSSSKL
ncbi:hypothetical protein GDO78_023040 [Eleutherodactylus coqui]|uniref:Olfactory receptor n=1 Tax=Eleutherodactylus coqui TaxID=57060 RepID=A0A8J6E7K4_ELECQ|nr:hypothetical protein GDO78_023040 [Eleutherodactylus coqui]